MDRKHIFAQLSRLPLERRWRRQPGPVLVVVALIQRAQEASDPRYLLIRRRHAPYAGKWALIGGKVDFGETLSVATVREVQEETGLDCVFSGLRGIVNERLAPAGPGDAGGHFLIFVCAVSAPDGMAREQQEGVVAWFSPEEIGVLHARQEIIPSDYAMFEQFSPGRDNLPYYEAEMIAANRGQAGAATPPLLSRFECIGH